MCETLDDIILYFLLVLQKHHLNKLNSAIIVFLLNFSNLKHNFPKYSIFNVLRNNFFTEFLGKFIAIKYESHIHIQLVQNVKLAFINL